MRLGHPVSLHAGSRCLSVLRPIRLRRGAFQAERRRCYAAKSPPAGQPVKRRKFKTPSKDVGRGSKTGTLQQRKQTRKDESSDDQALADLAALRQTQAKSASKQVSRVSGLQQKIRRHSTEPLPEAYATTVKNFLVRICQLTPVFQPTSAVCASLLVDEHPNRLPAALYIWSMQCLYLSKCQGQLMH